MATAAAAIIQAVKVETSTISPEKEIAMKGTKKRIWSKPSVQEEQAGMEVTSYASADLRRRSDSAPKKAG